MCAVFGGGDVRVGQVFVALPLDSAALPRGTMGGYGGLLLLLEPLQVPVLTARSRAEMVLTLTLQLSNNTVFLLESDLEHFQPLRIFEIRMRLERQKFTTGCGKLWLTGFAIIATTTRLISCGAKGSGAWVGALAGRGGGQSTCASQ